MSQSPFTNWIFARASIRKETLLPFAWITNQHLSKSTPSIVPCTMKSGSPRKFTPPYCLMRLAKRMKKGLLRRHLHVLGACVDAIWQWQKLINGTDAMVTNKRRKVVILKSCRRRFTYTARRVHANKMRRHQAADAAAASQSRSHRLCLRKSIAPAAASARPFVTAARLYHRVFLFRSACVCPAPRSTFEHPLQSTRTRIMCE